MHGMGNINVVNANTNSKLKELLRHDKLAYDEFLYWKHGPPCNATVTRKPRQIARAFARLFPSGHGHAQAEQRAASVLNNGQLQSILYRDLAREVEGRSLRRCRGLANEDARAGGA